jgi:hypothetical protein
MRSPRPLRFAAWCAALALAGLAASACTLEGSGCTAKGCSDGATVDLVTTSGAWAAGTYELVLLVDGESASCALKVPAVPSPQNIVTGACTSSIGLVLSPQAQCAADAGDAASADAGCAAGPGALEQVLTLPGMPVSVDLTLTRDGRMLLQQAIAFAYATVQPNGPSCAPTCHEATAVVDVPDGGR